MKHALIVLIWIGLSSCTKNQGPVTENNGEPLIELEVNKDGLKVLPPSKGIYHGAFPDLPEGSVTDLTTHIEKTENLVDKPLSFVTIQNDFVDGFQFPGAEVSEIAAQGKVPLIRMMPRSIRSQFYGVDPIYTMDRFLKGDFDPQLKEWAHQAKGVAGPMMVEFGPEVNGMWYPWSGRWNGWNFTDYYGDPKLFDGPERFRDAYRRIITLFRSEGVRNISWVFHVDSQPIPMEEPWNAMVNYYPGDDYIDWIGVSVFGAQAPGDWYGSFTQILDEKWGEISALSPKRPVAIVEWGVIEKADDANAKAQWIESALSALVSGKYPKIRAVNYWHERSWGSEEKHNFRLDSSPQALSAYKRGIRDPLFLSQMVVKNLGN